MTEEKTPFMEIERCYDCGRVADEYFKCDFDSNSYWQVVMEGLQNQFPDPDLVVVKRTEMKMILPKKIFCKDCIKSHQEEIIEI